MSWKSRWFSFDSYESPNIGMHLGTNNGAHICIESIGLFTLKPKYLFMVDFDVVFIELLYGLEGPDLDRRWFRCIILFKLFCIMCDMCVDNDGCMWQHKNA
jgi:hypothetical protein